MRVLHTPVRYPPHVGGIEAVAADICERLVARGDEAYVICAASPAAGPGREVRNGVRVLRLRAAFRVANTDVTPGLPAALWRAPVDVVHTHLPTPWSADWSVLVARLRRKPVVVTFYNRIVGTGLASVAARVYERTLQRVTLRLATLITVNSDSWRDRLVREQPALRGKVVTLLNGVDTDAFAPGEGPRSPELLFVSVLDEFHDYKGLDVLLDAMPLMPEATCTVVGDGSRRARYEARARSLGVADRVTFAGRVDDEALAGLYRTCGVFVLPSQYVEHEGGSSLVALEAMASGMPVVIAEGAGDIAKRAQDVGAGRAVPAGDAAALAAAVGELLADDALRARCGEAARAHVVAEVSWESFVDELRALYASLL
ncbi:MAG TPA: glycosyltransferase family 4 protein [Frankiaceae bacterium]|nr:glycosyltransferase family 4 protein [Frankiaceae bacterium]